MSDATDNAAAPNAAAPAKKKGKLLLLAAVALVALLASGGAYVILVKRTPAAARDKKSEKSADAGVEETKAVVESEDEGDGEKRSKPVKLSLPKDEGVKDVVELQPFIVNLADTEEARYLRLTVSLGLGGEGGGEKPDPLFTTRVRNALLAVLTTKRSDEILTVEGKDRLRKELLTAAKAASREPKVEAVYITDFIVQL